MRRYQLRFDDGHTEVVSAPGPTEAVKARKGYPESKQPHGIADLTAMAEWQQRLADRALFTAQKEPA